MHESVVGPKEHKHCDSYQCLKADHASIRPGTLHTSFYYSAYLPWRGWRGVHRGSESLRLGRQSRQRDQKSHWAWNHMGCRRTASKHEILTGGTRGAAANGGIPLVWLESLYLLGHKLPICIRAPFLLSALQQAQTWRVSDDNTEFTTRQPGHPYVQ